MVYRVASAHSDSSLVWRSFHSQYSRQYGRSLSGVEEAEGLAADPFQPTPAVRPGEEPDHLTPNAFKEDRLRRLVREALDKEQITLSRAAEILDVSTAGMRALASSWQQPCRSGTASSSSMPASSSTTSTRTRASSAP